MKSPNRPSVRLRGYLRRFLMLFVILYFMINFRVRLWRQPYSAVRAHANALAQRPPLFRDVGAGWVLLWVRRLGPFIPWGTCLVRALTAQVLLARRGVAVEIVFGAKFAHGGKFEAHAWVEYHGKVLLGQLPDLASHRVLRREGITLSQPRQIPPKA